MRIDLVLPVFNEEGNLRPLVQEIRDALTEDYDYRIIFVNDGSEDATEGILSDLAREYPEVVALHFDSNRGQSAAFEAGFEYAEGNLVVTLDSDRQNDPADIPRLIDELGEADMVAGYRANREDNWLRTVGSQFANWVRNTVTGDEIIDTGCSLKVFRRQVVKDLPVFRGMHRFFPTLAKMQGYSVKQVPTNHRARPEGETKYTMSGRLWTTARDLFGVRWLQHRNIETSIDSVEGEEN